jgi:alanyl-tRNA synthetase
MRSPVSRLRQRSIIHNQMQIAGQGIGNGQSKIESSPRHQHNLNPARRRFRNRFRISLGYLGLAVQQSSVNIHGNQFDGHVPILPRPAARRHSLYVILPLRQKGTDLTDRLYYHDSFLREFDATVVSCTPDGPRWKVILNKTAFYPTSGGQPHDLGTLGDAQVVEVVDVPNTGAPNAARSDVSSPGDPHHVVHYTTAEVPAGPIHGQIDWPRRLDHMQQHTAQHLLSAAFIELFGLQTVSFHLGKEISTIDLAAPSVVPRQIETAGRRANEIIFENRPVVIRFGTAQELAESGIRKKVDREGILRAIEIETFDRQPCGGTHLASTGQAGLILLRKLERTRENSRIEFVAGYRALAAARADFATLTQAATQLSCALQDVPAGITKNIEERRANTSAVKRLEERLATLEAQALLQQNPEAQVFALAAAPNAGASSSASATIRLIVATPPDATPAYLALLAAKLTTEKNVIALLASRESGHVVAARSADLTQDIGVTLRESLQEFQGKGGGAKHFAQGALPDPTQTDAFITTAKSRLRTP